MNADSLIEFDNIAVHYGNEVAIEELSGSLRRGATTCIVGPNGGGKSTLIKLIAGLLKPQHGRITRHVDQRDIAWLPQLANIERNVPISVLDTVCLGHWRQSGWFGRIDLSARRTAMAALEQVGMAERADALVHTLSSGQLQRVLFARLLLQDGQLILLDEPFNAVDARTSAELIALVDRWRDEGRTVVAVLHDLPLAKAHFPEALLLARHCLGWGPTEEVLTTDALGRARVSGHWHRAA